MPIPVSLLSSFIMAYVSENFEASVKRLVIVLRDTIHSGLRQ